MQTIVAVAFGGALGAVARYQLGIAIERINPWSIPLGTLMVNIIGSLLIGILYVAFEHHPVWGGAWRPVLTVGFLGAFTTFSTFSVETVSLMLEGQVLAAITYITMSVVCCLIASFAGIAVARYLVSI